MLCASLKYTSYPCIACGSSSAANLWTALTSGVDIVYYLLLNLLQEVGPTANWSNRLDNEVCWYRYVKIFILNSFCVLVVALIRLCVCLR